MESLIPVLDDFARTSPFAKDVFIRAQQQMLVSAFARSNMDAQSLEKFSKLLEEINNKGGN